MTTFKYFTIERIFPTRSEIQIAASILLLIVLSYSNIFSQSNLGRNQQGISTPLLVEKGKSNVNISPSVSLDRSELSELPLNSENEEEGNRIEDDLAIDQERTDGIDMYLNGTYYRGTSIIKFEIELLQEGYTVVDVLDPASGDFLLNLMDGNTKPGKVTFEIDQNDFNVSSIIIVARQTVFSGTKIESSLLFEFSRTEDIPLNSSESVSNVVSALLTPTLGRGFFQIHADIKTAGIAAVKVYDLNGQLIQTLFSGKIQVGAMTFEGSSSNWIAGNYIVCIHTEKGSWVGKMIVQ